MGTNQMQMNFFATTAKGLEEVLAGELGRLGVGGPVVEKGGVGFSGDMSDCYRANLWLRTAHRVLMPLAEFACDTPQSLYDGVRSLPWTRYLTADHTIAVDCNLRDSALTHSGFVALKTKDAIVDTIRDVCGRRPNVHTADPDVLINVHLVRNRCIVSLDTSGASLDKRGYRLDRKEAPLRETLAAAMLELAGWDGSVPLVDPMCGSGTIPIEAALVASRRPPGLTRPGFGFQRWPGFDRAAWSRMVEEAMAGVLESPPMPIMGSDVSAGALQNAERNAARAGVGGLVNFCRADMGDSHVPCPLGILLCNPPYGVRLGEVESLKPLYKRIGDVLKRRFTGYSAYLLTGNPELSKHIGLRPSRRVVLFNGPIECRLLRFDLY